MLHVVIRFYFKCFEKPEEIINITRTDPSDIDLLKKLDHEDKNFNSLVNFMLCLKKIMIIKNTAD